MTVPNISTVYKTELSPLQSFFMRLFNSIKDSQCKISWEHTLQLTNYNRLNLRLFCIFVYVS
jgi:hypothetical protein